MIYCLQRKSISKPNITAKCLMESKGLGSTGGVGTPSPALPCPRPNSTHQSLSILSSFAAFVQSVTNSCCLFLWNGICILPLCLAVVLPPPLTLRPHPGSCGSKPRQSAHSMSSKVASENPALSHVSTQQSAQRGSFSTVRTKLLRPSYTWPSLHSYSGISQCSLVYTLYSRCLLVYLCLC